MSKPLKTVLIWVLLVVMFFAIYQVLTPPAGEVGAAPVDAHPSTGVFVVVAAVVFVAALMFLVLRRAQSGAQSIFTMRKTTARLIPEVPDASFADVGGADEIKERLGDVVDFLKNPERWRKAGARLPRGVLLEGPPGCGKTLLARAVAGEAKAPFFEVSASEFVELLVGVGPARVRDLFEQAAKKAPAIIFIDELDAIGRRRGSAASIQLHAEYEQTLNQLLVSMDGFRPTDRVVVIAATNRADVLDEALVRPGRFDLKVKMPPLDLDGRLEVLRIHTRTRPLAGDVDLPAIAGSTDGLTGAELEHLANEASLSATRRARRTKIDDVRLDASDFSEALARRRRDEGHDEGLDALLHESSAHVTKPKGRMPVRVTFEREGSVEGELVWASPQFLKVRAPDGREVTVSRAGVRQVEALDEAKTAKRDVGAEAHRAPLAAEPS